MSKSTSILRTTYDDFDNIVAFFALLLCGQMFWRAAVLGFYEDLKTLHLVY